MKRLNYRKDKIRWDKMSIGFNVRGKLKPIVLSSYTLLEYRIYKEMSMAQLNKTTVFF